VPAPRATYRLQLGPGFDFDHAAALAPYLARLGVSHVYTSPLTEAEPGSTHGYDAVDPQRVRGELGGERGLRRLWEALRAHGLGQVVDLVPNHLSIAGRGNRWWWDVLENGSESAWARHFDIEWDHPDPEVRGRVVLPFLARPFDEAVDAGEIRVHREPSTGDVLVTHGDRLWPASEASLAWLGLSALDCRERVEEELAVLARDPVRWRGFLDQQHYLLVYWRDPEHLPNYRRFFDVSDLAALRVDDPAVFADTHLLLRRWVDDDLAGEVVTGVRVDHIDGLVDPETYLNRLRELIGDRWLVVEKILAADETLPGSWPVDGTTGYEFTARATEVGVDREGDAALSAAAREIGGTHGTWADTVDDAKAMVAGTLLRPEADRLTRAFPPALAEHGATSTDPPDDVEHALTALACALDVYRVYTGRSDPDRTRLTAAAARATARRGVSGPVVASAVSLLTAEEPGPRTRAFAARFAQLTAPLAAKAVEDTACYRYLRLVSLNEVGGDPGRFGLDPGSFVAWLDRAARDHPRSMLALSTHDTKRSADVRARISLIAQVPDAWRGAVQAWHEHNRPHLVNGAPDRAVEYLAYQTLVGAWPLSTTRLLAYLVKAAREAKVQTSWTDPSPAFEDAIAGFVAGMLGDETFVASLEAFLAPLVRPGQVAALAQVVVALTAPGVPDLYQGDETWNRSLVDPDNRRTIDVERLARLLADVEGLSGAEAWGEGDVWGDDDGLPKLLVVHRLLLLRRERPDLFADDLPVRALAVTGPEDAGVLAYRRGDALAVIVPHLALRAATERAGATVTIPPGDWRHLFTDATVDGPTVDTATLFGDFPVAVLWSADPPRPS